MQKHHSRHQNVRRRHRFKVQRRVPVLAHDRSDKLFLFAEVWRTVVEADKLVTAEKLLLHAKHESSKATQFRIAEEWPFGSELRPLR